MKNIQQTLASNHHSWIPIDIYDAIIMRVFYHKIETWIHVIYFETDSKIIIDKKPQLRLVLQGLALKRKSGCINW